MQRLDAGFLQARFEVEVEIRRVDADEQIGPFDKQAARQLLSNR